MGDICFGDVMKDTRRWRSSWTLFVVGGMLAAGLTHGVMVPHDHEGALKSLALSDPALHPSVDLVAVSEVGERLTDDVRFAWAELSQRQIPVKGSSEKVGLAGWTAAIDRRSGLVEIAEGAGVPWIPGYGNQLTHRDVASHLRRADLDPEALESIARSSLPELAPLIGADAYELRLNRGASGKYSDYVWFVEFDVYKDDLKIEGARIFFRVNNGNLIQFGAERVPAPGTSVPAILLSRDQAFEELDRYVGLTANHDRLIDKGSLRLLPVAAGGGSDDYAFGQGYELLPVWELAFRRGEEHPTWRARIDATTGEILDFRDVNRYAQVTGGYWPVSWKVDGTVIPQVQTGWPFASIEPLGATSNTSGLYTWDGNPQAAYHTGPYVNIVDSCGGAAGTASSDASGNIDFGTFTPPDGTTPGDCTNQLGIGDNTPAARQQYWHVNKIMEKARSYFPTNSWLQQQLTVNVNINLTCNAFWNGSTLNFYRTNGACYNLGANAGVSMHEWGHGMDSNDGNGASVENGTGETYGDFSGALQTLNSCIGNGIFVSGVCGGYGNPCVAGGCDGIRDIDWGRHTANEPMTVASFIQPLCPSDAGGNYNGPCGNGAPLPDDKEGHCESYVSSGALWDLAAADLQSGCSNRNPAFPDYNCPGAGGPYNSAGAWQTVDRLWYLSRPTANQAFSCFRTLPTWTSDGCNAGSNWKTFRAIDDDDGNLANGTPHACQIAAAFNRHGIGNTAGSSCASDVTTCFRACPQPAAPTLNTPGAGNNAVTLDWTPESGGDVIDIYRNEAGCNFGFSRIANDVTGSVFSDTEVANGTTYYYQIVRHPVGNESCASPPSNCVSATPTPQPSARYVGGSASLIAVPTDNDADGFVDNCETGRLQVGIVNDGVGALSNVRFTVTSPDPEVTIAGVMPVVVGSLAENAQTTGSFDFDLDGATCGQTLDFDISVTADEMAGSTFDGFSHGAVEQDLTPTPSRTDDFETSNDGWTFVQGYARENVSADSGTWSVHSSSGLNDQIDVALSAPFQKGAGASQVVIAVRYDIEAPFWDRANVEAIRLSDDSYTLLTPTGRTYTAGGPWNPVGHVGTQPGWAGTNLTWGDATFDLSGLDAGESYRLRINYNTDAFVAGTGHWFDHVRWTNVAFQSCDAASDVCTPCTPPDAPTGLTANATAPGQISLAWSAVVPAPSQYRIYRATMSGGPYTLAGSVGGGTLSFDDTGLTAGETYYYVVRAVETCESADSGEASDTAFGDCSTPPTFGGLQSVSPIAAGGSCGLRLEWLSGTDNCDSGPLVYNVYRSTTPGFTPGPGNLLQACVTGNSWDDTSTVSGTTYSYIVRAEDAVTGGGGSCRDGNPEANGVEISGAVGGGGGGSSTLYSNDFESGTPPYDGDWGVKGFTGDTAPVTWRGIQTCTANSGSRVFRFGGVGCTDNYDPNEFELAEPQTATGIAVPAGATNVTLSFDHRRQFQRDRDGGSLWLSLDGTNYDFIDATAISGTTYNGALNNTCPVDAGLVGLPVFTRNANAFTQTTVDLDAVCDQITGGSTGCSGLTIWPGFMSITDCGGHRDGWFLDDVEVTADLPAACTPAPSAVQFLTNTAVDGANQLEWLNPASGGYGSTMIRFATDGYPQDPSDGTLLVDQDDGSGGKGTASHGGLTNGTTYFYSAFVDNGAGETSARKTVSGRPFDTSGNVNWAYSTGASALAPPGIGSVYGVANDRVLHSMDVGGSPGNWPAGWRPLAMNGPAQSRPPIVPVALMGAAKVALLSSQDGRVYAVDASTGSMLWSSPDLPPAGSLIQGSPAGTYAAFGGLDVLMVGTRHATADNQVHGLDFADGTILWSFTNSVAQGGDGSGLGIISGKPSLDIAGNRLYVTSRARAGGSQHTVWCISFDRSGASLLWSRALGDIDGSPILLGSKLYVGTNSSRVHVLDALDGSDLWSAPFDADDGPIKGYIWPRFGTSDLYFSTTTRVWSITDGGATSSLNWSTPSIPSPSIPLVSFADPLAWVGGGDGRLYQLDISGGSPSITSVVLGDGSAAVGSPAFDVVTETAYVGSDAGHLYSVSLPLPASRGPVDVVEPETLKPFVEDGEASKAGRRCRIRVGERGNRIFSATEILDLGLRVRVRSPGEHVLRLELSTPSGHHYQTLTVPFSSDASRAGQARKIAGFPRPLGVQSAKASSTEGALWSSVIAQFPVAGTPIVHSSLYGRWTVRAYLDDEVEPCGRHRRFVLEP